MRLLGNIIWFLFGGVFIFFEYVLAGFVLAFTIIGIPFAIQCFKLAVAHLAPFGKEVVPNGNANSCLSLLFNIIWIVSAGLCIAITHITFGLLFCLTIVGIPFGVQHFKLVRLCFAPFGQELK